MAKSKLSILDRFNSKWCPEPFSGCWLWTEGCDQKGYGLFSSGIKDYRAHRFSWGLYRSPVPAGMCVLHHCDTPSCVNPSHLFIGSVADNNHDCDRKGRRERNRAKGERVGTAVITADLVRTIRQSTETDYKLAKRMPISHMQIRRIRNRESWAHVT